MVKAIVFDCFGVLTEDGWLAFVHQWVTPDTLDAANYLNHQLDVAMIAYPDFLDQIAVLTGASKDEVNKMIRRYHHRNAALLTYITQLKKHYKIGLLSNIGGNYLAEFLTKEDLTLFDAMSLSCETGFLKPNSEAYQDICTKLDTLPEEAIFIDDREGYCEGARTVGLQAVHYTGVSALRRELAKLHIG